MRSAIRGLRLTLLGISAVGAALFMSGFVLSFTRPILVESLLRELIRRQVETRVSEAISGFDGAALNRLAARAIDRNAARIAQIKTLLQDLPAKVDAVVAEMQSPSCECRKFVTTAATTFLTLDMAGRTEANEVLLRFIGAKYAHVSRELLREFRIFTVANALVFFLLGLVTLTRKRAALQLLLPAVALLLSGALVASFYLLAQDWLHTIVFSEYVGLGYFAYLAVALAFFADVVFNRARVSTEVVNAVFNLAGSAIQAVPC